MTFKLLKIHQVSRFLNRLLKIMRQYQFATGPRNDEAVASFHKFKNNMLIYKML